MVEGYPDAPADDAVSEVKEAVERWKEEVDESVREDIPLLYWLLGSGTPEYKMSKEDSAYQEEPHGDEVCANCQYYYEGTDGQGVCSKVRGQVWPEHWCDLWEPGDNLQANKFMNDAGEIELMSDSEPQVIEMDRDVEKDSNIDIVKDDSVGLARKDEGEAVDEWIPYIGDRGGEGWQTADGERTVYTDSPPGDKMSAEDAAKDVIGMTDEQYAAVEGSLTEAEESDVADADEVLQTVIGQLARRRDEIGDVTEQDTDDIRQFSMSIVEREVDRVEEIASREPWEDLIHQNTSLDQQDTRFTITDIEGSIREVSDQFNVDEGRVVDEINRVIEELGGEKLVDEGEDPVSVVRTALDSAEEQIADEMPVQEMFDPDIRDRFEDMDFGVSDMKDATKNIFGWMSDERDALPSSWDASLSANEEFELAVESIVENTDTSKTELANELNDHLEMEMFPFADHGGDISPAMNPNNGDVKSFADVGIGGGRSSRSMFVADGVPDEDGNERRLFVTNTNPDRGPSEVAEDGERCVAGSAGFSAAGVPVARYANVDGEFWVAENAGGKKCADSSVDHTDLDQPIEQFVEMMAVGSVLGATDLHEDNVHIKPETGQLVPVDLDLIGAETHHNASAFDNKFFDQDDMRNRAKRAFDAADMQEVADYAEVWDAVKERSKQLQKDGTLRKVVDAATTDSSSMDVNMSIEENMMRLESDDFWQDQVTAPDGGMDAIRDELGLPEPDDANDKADLDARVNAEVDPGDISSLDEDEENDAITSQPEDEPFTDYDECVEYHGDKTDPGAYCAVIFGFDESDIDDEDEEDEYDEEGGIDQQLSDGGL